MRDNNFPQYVNVRIQYVYYDLISSSEVTENIVHQVHHEKILDCLEQNHFVLKKEDIIFLLKDDGADFIDDSIRIYEPAEDNYFQVPDDWELEVDENDPEFSLLFWIKSTNPNIKRKIDEVYAELKALKEAMGGNIHNYKLEMKASFEKYGNELEKLRTTNKLLFHQLAEIHKKMLPEIPDHSSDDSDHDDKSSNKSIPDPDTRLGKSRGIDIALMYSEPLVKRDAIGIVSLGDPVDYEEECNRLLDLLKSKEKRVDVYFEIATVENLVNVLSLSPKILHIICHGEFSKENNQFYLCFEEDGELKELYSSDLKDKLAEIKLKTQIVFVNACHSEEVARVFQEAGVPCVIAVQSELKIEDHIAQKFSETFYWQLFEGQSINEAFNLARVAVRSAKDIYTCCCAHSHKEDCEWYKLAKEEGFEKAHHLHTPTCTSCKHNNKFLHNQNCKWAQDFLMFVCGMFDLPDETLHACCCSPEYPHNEVMKFKLLCTNEEFGKKALFKNPEKGKVTIKSYHSCVDQKFPVKRLTGRNKELYGMYEALMDKDKKYINLYGIEGVGKSSLMKQIANYLFERGIFKDKISLIALDRTPSILHFRSDLFKEVSGAYDLKTFSESIKKSKALFILDKCDRFIKQETEEFRRDLAWISEYAANVKFVIITNEMINLKLTGVSYVNMRELKKIDAAKLLCKGAYASLKWDQRNIYKLQEHGIFDLIPLTPQGIWSITEKLRHGKKTLDEIEREMLLERENNDGNPVNELDEATKMTLEDIRSLDETAYELFIFICLFPAGLAYQDLEMLEIQKKIPPNWKYILLSFLTAKVNFDDHVTTPGETPGLNVTEIDRNSFKPDNYIWITIDKNPNNNDIYFVPTQFLTRYIENHLIEDCLEANIKKLEYIALLSLAIIEKAKLNYEYNEKLIEFSMVSHYGIWEIGERKYFDLYNDRNQILYIKNLPYDQTNLKKCFQSHKSNFLCCIEPKVIQDILQEDESKNEHIIEILEVLYLSVPTLFKIMQTSDSEAQELASSAERYLDFLNEDPRLQALKVKINLFLTALNLSSKDPQKLPLVKVQLGLLGEQEGDIQDEDMRKYITSELEFARAIMLYKEFKANHKGKETNYKELKALLKGAKARLPDYRMFDVNKAKITILECKVREAYGITEIEKELVEDIDQALAILTSYKSQKLLMKAHYIAASLKAE